MEYPLPGWGVRNQKFTPRELSPILMNPVTSRNPAMKKNDIFGLWIARLVSTLIFIRSRDSGVTQKPRFIRELYKLGKNTAPGLFTAAIKRATE